MNRVASSSPLRALLVAGAGAFAALSVAADAPQEQPDFSPPAGEVTIIRDRWGMAHLYATREQDGYWGLGYALGGDRLLATLFHYRAVRGELAAAFGRAPIPAFAEIGRGAEKYLVVDPVESDRKVLRDQLLADARRNFPQLSPQLQRNMRSFIAGLRQYMVENPHRVPAWAPELEPALPLALFSMYLFSPSDDVCLAKLAVPGQLSTRPQSPAEKIMPASNAWVLDGRRTASGKPILGSDSHGPIEALGGTFAYPWRMHANDIDVFGMDLTGTAVALFGHTRHYAWGWTEGPRRTEECVRVVTRADNPRVYDVDGRAQRMKVLPYEIRVKGEAPVKGQFEYLEEGALRSPVVHRDAQSAYAVRFSYTGRAGFAPDQHRRLLLAKQPDDLRSVFGSLELYPANLIVGGADGTLAYIRPGRIPRRTPQFDPALFTDGNRSTAAWRELHSMQELVQVWNPPEGFLVNDNASPESLFNERVLSATDYPSYFEMEAGTTNARQERHKELLSQARGATIDDAQKFTFDNMAVGTSAWAHQAAVLLPRRVDTEESDEVADLRAMAAELAEFDGRFDSHSAGALYTTLILESVARDVSPDLRVRLAANIQAGVSLSQEEREALRAAALNARNELKVRCGTVLRNLGDVFRVGRGSVSTPSSGINLVLRGPPGSAFPGGLNFMQLAAPQANTYAGWLDGCRRERNGGTRAPMLVGFGEPLQSFSLLAFGMSDDPASPHFSDQSLLAGREQLRPNFFDAVALRDNLTSVTRRRTELK